MQNYIDTLISEFSKNSNSEIAKGQIKYMKNNFYFLGLKTPLRRKIQKPFLVSNYLPAKDEAFQIVKLLWQKPEREYHYFAQELAFKYVKQIEKEDIILFEYMIVNQSWWDTTDFIAPKLAGAYFKQFPELRDKYTNKWLKSENIWLQRSAILFQLHYKNEVDTILLSLIINILKNTNEFFIQKAIGWMLRQYSSTNPSWVIEFVANTELSGLSSREALRLLNKKY